MVRVTVRSPGNRRKFVDGSCDTAGITGYRLRQTRCDLGLQDRCPFVQAAAELDENAGHRPQTKRYADAAQSARPAQASRLAGHPCAENEKGLIAPAS